MLKDLLNDGMNENINTSHAVKDRKNGEKGGNYGLNLIAGKIGSYRSRSRVA